MSDSGILTMCYDADWHKAIGLSLSLRARSNALPTAVVAPESLRHKLEPFFDQFIPERTNLTGFMHKVFLDEYSPYKKTLFLDADLLVLQDPQILFDRWGGSPYMVRGKLVKGGSSFFGLNRGEVLSRTGKSEFACIDSAGHAYFEKPDCHRIFERARDILSNYNTWAPGAKVADEDIIGIVMTEFDIIPDENKQVVGFPLAVHREIARMDAVKGECKYIDKENDIVEPFAMHYFNNMSPISYHHQMARLSKSMDGPGWRVWWMPGIAEFVHYKVWWGMKSIAKKALARL